MSSGDPGDVTFIQQHADLEVVSIRVQGTYNGQAYTFVTDLNVDQRFDLNPALVVDGSTTTNVTARADISGWFVDGAGAAIDPNEANKGGEYENVVKDNIKDSIEAFEDRDRDGNWG